MVRFRTPANHPGTHFLRSPATAARLVRCASVGHGSTVLDVGAGTGAITAPLAQTGARVLAIERDPRLVARLRARFGADERVTVIHGDALRVPLPRRRFHVVASIPFAISTPLLRRLFDGPLEAAELIVEWGLAKRLTEPRPRSLEAAWWSACFALRLRRRISATCFAPSPSVDAAHLAIRRRENPPPATKTLLRCAYAAPEQPARVVLGQVVGRRDAGRVLTASRIDPPAPAATVTVDQWLGVARAVRHA